MMDMLLDPITDFYNCPKSFLFKLFKKNNYLIGYTIFYLFIEIWNGGQGLHNLRG